MTNNLSKDSVIGVFKTIKIIPAQELPFPQTLDFNKILDLGDALATQNLSLEEVSQLLSISVEDAEKVGNAASYLYLVNIYHEYMKGSKKTYYRLDENGSLVFNLSGNPKLLFLAKTILEEKVFYQVFKEYLENDMIPSESEIITLMKKNKIFGLNTDDDYKKGCKTITSWIKWIIKLYE